jgi:hypothetical protein
VEPRLARARGLPGGRRSNLIHGLIRQTLIQGLGVVRERESSCLVAERELR